MIMPLEAGALLLDAIGWGKPLWFLCGLALDLLLRIAHAVASAKGVVAMLPSMPGWSFGLMVAGGLWLCLWTKRWRLLGLAPFLGGAAAAALSPSPDVLVTGDGRHLAVVSADGTPLILRDRAGDYVRDLLAEASGFDGDPAELGSTPFSDCSNDACVVILDKEGTRWRILATRSAYRIGWGELASACAESDIVVSDRRLPRGCEPRWLRLDPATLSRSGGLAIYVSNEPRVESVAERVGHHPWADIAR